MPAGGRGDHGVLTSESQAGDRVAAPVLLHTGEVAGPHQQAAQHGSAAVGAQRGAGRTRAGAEGEYRAQAPTEEAPLAPQQPCQRELSPSLCLRGEVPTPGRGCREGIGHPLGGPWVLAPAWIRPACGGWGGAGVRRAPVGALGPRPRNGRAADAGCPARPGSWDTALRPCSREPPVRSSADLPLRFFAAPGRAGTPGALGERTDAEEKCRRRWS